MPPPSDPTPPDAAGPTPGATSAFAKGPAGPAPAGVLWSRWLAFGWLVLFVLGCLAIARPSRTLLQRLDLRAAFRGDAPSAPVDAPGEE